MVMRSALRLLGVATMLATAVASMPARADWDGFRGGDGRGYDGDWHRRFEHRRPHGYGFDDGYGPRRFAPPPVYYAPPPVYYYAPPRPYYVQPGY